MVTQMNIQGSNTFQLNQYKPINSNLTLTILTKIIETLKLTGPKLQECLDLEKIRTFNQIFQYFIANVGTH